jgi:TRAP-type C4-dicarboxylate transport system substrate-binding protein
MQTRKIVRTVLTALAALALLVAPAAQAKVRIKMGTLAPVGSTWHQLLEEMGHRWKEASGGEVELKVYAGGVLGNEGDMVRKMNVGQLQAAAITTVGMHEITPEPQAVDVPLMADSIEEYEFIQNGVQAELEQYLAAKGFVAVQWGEVGFARFFSTKPYKSPQEMAAGKIFTWEGDPAAEAAWRAMGLHPVVISSTDIVPSLQTGMINIICDPPLYTYTTRLFEKARYMLNLNWGYLTGATVVRKDAWEKIPAETRQKLLEIAAEYGKKTAVEVRRMNNEALDKMKEQGLQVVEPSSREEWQTAFDKAEKVIRGKVVPISIYDKVKTLRDEFRSKHSSK